MSRKGAVVALAVLMAWLSGCAEQRTDRPPVVRYGESTCVDCDMIISDERFASATMVRDERGGVASLLFDDIGDQIRYEREHPELKIEARWVHDYGTKAWLVAERAWYVKAEALHTPMASGIAAFDKREDAEAMAKEFAGDVLGFGALWVKEHNGHGR